MNRIFAFLLLITPAICVELTFELADSEKQCFHEAIEAGIESTVDFQVIYGGNYDVDATLEGPHGAVLMRAVKKQADTLTWKAQQSGVYTLCFSNEFSTFAHKMIYMDFEVGKEKPLPGVSEHPSMTKLESNSAEIHNKLATIIDFQTHHRLMESQSRKRAEDLNFRVMWWSLGETVIILVVTLSVITILKSFFSEKK